MALKKLLTDLTKGVNAYPNHNTPSTSGGFNYGQSYSRIFDSHTYRQKSYRFGEGRASDRPGGAYSKEPYLYNGFLSADSLPDVDNPQDKNFLGKFGDFVDSATDGLIRGGLITSIKRSGQDLLRIGKWMVDGPQGPMWLLTQTGLQRSNPKTEETSAGSFTLFGKTVDLGGNSRTYMPLGLTTLTQTLVGFAGLHINRAGLLPLGSKNYKLEQGYGVDSNNEMKYEYAVRTKDANMGPSTSGGEGDSIEAGSMLDYDLEKGTFGGNRLISLAHEHGSKLESDRGELAGALYKYSGGPHSIYGLGSTKLKRYYYSIGPQASFYTRSDSFMKPFPVNEGMPSLGTYNFNAFKNITTDVEGRMTSYNIDSADLGFHKNVYVVPEGVSLKGTNAKKLADIAKNERLDERGHKRIWYPWDYAMHPRNSYLKSTIDVDNFLKFPAKELDDGSTVPFKPHFDYQQKTANGKRFIREERVNLGNPGNTRINQFNYDAYLPQTVDKINALDVMRTKGEFNKQEFRDLIRFRIEAIDSDKPDEADTMMFRAFLDDYSDNYTANWNNFKYNGRGEEMYTYNSFKRTLNFSFKVAAQSRWEMMPLYRKLNFLVSNTAPEYKKTRMRSPFIRLTIGSMIDRTPGILTSVGLKWQKDYPWEISIDSPENGRDKEMLVLPHVLDVTVAFTAVHNFLPQKSVSNSPFILSHENNRWLSPQQKWYKAGAAGMTEIIKGKGTSGEHKILGYDNVAKSLRESTVEGLR